MLAWLQLLRGQVAKAASFLHTTRECVTPADSQPLPWTETEIAESRRREQELTERSQRCQSAVDMFRIRKETAKAGYTAASARRDVYLAVIAGLAGPADDRQRLELAEAQADLATAEVSLRIAAADLRATLAEAARLCRTVAGDLIGSVPPAPGRVTAGLTEAHER